MNRDQFVRWELRFIVGMPLLAILGSCCGCPIPIFSAAFLMVEFHLLAGWAIFLERVAPQINPDWFTIGLAAFGLLGLAGGLHWFCGWLHREVTLRRAPIDPGSETAVAEVPKWHLRTTLSILGIILLTFVAGTAAVGIVHQIVWMKSRA